MKAKGRVLVHLANVLRKKMLLSLSGMSLTRIPLNVQVYVLLRGNSKLQRDTKTHSNESKYTELVSFTYRIIYFLTPLSGKTEV